MTPNERKSTYKEREVRVLAAKIPDEATFERILLSTPEDKRNAVRGMLLPYLTFPVTPR